MGQIYSYLGLLFQSSILKASHTSMIKMFQEKKIKNRQVGSFKVVYDFQTNSLRAEAYLADITFGTNNEFGFDYLRDNLAQNDKNCSAH